MGITLQEVVDNGLISDDLIQVLPNDGHCECGAEIEFTDSLRQVYCPDRYCYLKIAARLEAMAKHMKADGWGESTCIQVCKDFKLKSPYQVFLLENAEYSGVPAFKKKIEAICDTAKRRLKLWEVVKLAGIPNIETIAYKIFDGYKNISNAYEDIERYQVPLIADKLGLKNADTGVMAVNIYNNLIEFKTELLFGEKQFTVYEDSGEKVQIAITGGVSGFPNKSAFVNYINLRYGGKISVMLMNSVVSNIDALIADGDANSNKYKTACRLNEKAKEKAIKNGNNEWHEIKIMESAEYIEYLDSIYGVQE
jgi:hypothetical protein